MPVSQTWTDPNTIDSGCTTGTILTQATLEQILDNLDYYGGSNGTSGVAGRIGTADLASNAVTQNIGFTQQSGNVTTTSTSYTDLDVNLNIVVTTSGGTVLVWGVASISSSAAGDTFYLAAAMDGNAEVGEVFSVQNVASDQNCMAVVARFLNPSAGSHTFRLRWKGSNGANTYTCGRRNMICAEFKK